MGNSGWASVQMKTKYLGASIDLHKNLCDVTADEAAQALADRIDKELIMELDWQRLMKTHAHWHQVELKWEKGKDTSYFWNEACAWAMEQFGLPGDRYVTHPTQDNMIFLFKDEKDAIMMTLKWI